MGFRCLKARMLEPLPGGSLLFTTKFTEIPAICRISRRTQKLIELELRKTETLVHIRPCQIDFLFSVTRADAKKIGVLNLFI